MKIERRKLSHNKQRDQVVTTLNAEFLREIEIDPNSRVNVIYDDIQGIAVICPEENLNRVLDTRSSICRLLKDDKCPTCGVINLDRNCKKCNKTY